MLHIAKTLFQTRTIQKADFNQNKKNAINFKSNLKADTVLFKTISNQEIAQIEQKALNDVNAVKTTALKLRRMAIKEKSAQRKKPLLYDLKKTFNKMFKKEPYEIEIFGKDDNKALVSATITDTITGCKSKYSSITKNGGCLYIEEGDNGEIYKSMILSSNGKPILIEYTSRVSLNKITTKRKLYFVDDKLYRICLDGIYDKHSKKWEWGAIIERDENGNWIKKNNVSRFG